MNKTKRVNQRATITMDGTWNLEKWKWSCAVCGAIYVMQNRARQCQHKSRHYYSNIDAGRQFAKEA